MESVRKFKFRIVLSWMIKTNPSVRCVLLESKRVMELVLKIINVLSPIALSVLIDRELNSAINVFLDLLCFYRTINSPVFRLLMLLIIVSYFQKTRRAVRFAISIITIQMENVWLRICIELT